MVTPSSPATAPSVSPKVQSYTQFVYRPALVRPGTN